MELDLCFTPSTKIQILNYLARNSSGFQVPVKHVRTNLQRKFRAASSDLQSSGKQLYIAQFYHIRQSPRLLVLFTCSFFHIYTTAYHILNPMVRPEVSLGSFQVFLEPSEAIRTVPKVVGDVIDIQTCLQRVHIPFQDLQRALQYIQKSTWKVLSSFILQNYYRAFNGSFRT